MTPFRLNPDFPPGMHHKYLEGLWSFDQMRLHHLWEGDSVLPAHALAARMNKPDIPIWPYLLLTQFLKSIHRKHDCSSPLTPFDNLCQQEGPIRRLTSTIHSLLLDRPNRELDSRCQKWENDLSISLSKHDWENIFIKNHKCSLNVNVQENGFKIISRWYRTPSILHKLFPSSSPTCWRCLSGTGSILHIFWSCPILTPFWTSVHKIIKQVTSLDLEFTPAQFLLHHSSRPCRSYCKSLTAHMINAARQCIPALWNSTKPPSIKQWLLRIAKIAEMEELIYITRDSPTTFYKIWACWIHFKSTADFARLSC